MKEQPLPSYEQYKERQKWAAEKAEELGVEYTEKDVEHFQIPVYDEEGKEIKRHLLPIWEKIPIMDRNNKIIDNIPIDDAVEALKKFPNDSLVKAVEKLKKS